MSFLHLVGDFDQPRLSKEKTKLIEVARRRVGVRCKEVGINESGVGTSSSVWSLL